MSTTPLSKGRNYL